MVELNTLLDRYREENKKFHFRFMVATMFVNAVFTEEIA